MSPIRDGDVFPDDRNSRAPMPWAPRAMLPVWGLRVLALLLGAAALVPVMTIGTARPARTFDLDRIAGRLTALDSLRSWQLPDNQMPRAVADDAHRQGVRDTMVLALRRLGAAPDLLPNRRTANASGTRPWNALAPDAGMFTEIRSAQYRGPNPSLIVSRARAGFTNAERSYLRAMADAPVWDDFERLAHLSPAVGLLQPLQADGDSARVPLPSLLSFGDARQLAIASVYRAAWALTTGDSAAAARVLQHTLTTGFAIIDVGTGAVDALAGAMLVDMARDGLQQLRTHDSPASAVNRTALVRPRMAFIESMMNQTAGTPTHQLRRELSEAVADSALPRVLRLQALQSLVLTNCDEVRTALFGARDDMRRTVQQARVSMTQVPADTAFFDAIDESLEAGPAIPASMANNSSQPAGTAAFVAPWAGRLKKGVATVGDAVAWTTGTPRIARCTRRALQTR